jgi:hypothetical protein
MACASTNQIVQRLLVLASDPDNIKFIVEQSGCLTGLTSYLVDNDIEVVKKAVETISLLASNKDARKYLAEHEGLVENLTALLSSTDVAVQNFATSAYKSLKRYKKKASKYNNAENNSENMNTLNDNYLKQVEKSKKKKSKKKRLKTYKLKVKDLDDDEICSRIEQGIIRVQGIISLTLDQNKRRVIVTSNKSKEKIIPKITEVIESCGTTVILKKRKRSDEASGYCDDEETEDIFGEGVLSKFGSQTLQSRLAAQRQKEEKRKLEESNVSRLAQAAGGAARWGMGLFGY